MQADHCSFTAYLWPASQASPERFRCRRCGGPLPLKASQIVDHCCCGPIEQWAADGEAPPLRHKVSLSINRHCKCFSKRPPSPPGGYYSSLRSGILEPQIDWPNSPKHLAWQHRLHPLAPIARGERNTPPPTPFLIQTQPVATICDHAQLARLAG